jgi:hypothetical protein
MCVFDGNAFLAGTFSLLARAADLLRAGPQSKRRSCLGAAVFDVWIFAERLPCGHHNDDLWARLSCPTQEIPAIAQLLHVTLQQQGNQRPADIRGVSRAADVCLVADMVRKLVWGCATAGWGQVPAGSGLHGQEQSQTALRQAAGALGAVLQEGGPGQVLVDKRMSAAERALVRPNSVAAGSLMLASCPDAVVTPLHHSHPKSTVNLIMCTSQVQLQQPLLGVPRHCLYIHDRVQALAGANMVSAAAAACFRWSASSGMR